MVMDLMNKRATDKQNIAGEGTAKISARLVRASFIQNTGDGRDNLTPVYHPNHNSMRPANRASTTQSWEGHQLHGRRAGTRNEDYTRIQR